MSASPISEVMLFGADCESVSAAFFSPSHAIICSLIHVAAFMPAMIAAKLRGSNKLCLKSWPSCTMKSRRSVPDLARMSRFSASIEAWLRAINSAAIAGSSSICAWKLAGDIPGLS